MHLSAFLISFVVGGGSTVEPKHVLDVIAERLQISCSSLPKERKQDHLRVFFFPAFFFPPEGVLIVKCDGLYCLSFFFYPLRYSKINECSPPPPPPPFPLNSLRASCLSLRRFFSPFASFSLLVVSFVCFFFLLPFLIAFAEVIYPIPSVFSFSLHG